MDWAAKDMANHLPHDMTNDKTSATRPFLFVTLVWLMVALCLLCAGWMFFSAGPIMDDYFLIFLATIVLGIAPPVFMVVAICVEFFTHDRSTASRIISILNDQLDRALRNREGRELTIRRLAGSYFWSLARSHILSYYLPLCFLTIAIWLIQMKRLNNYYPHSVPSLATLSWPIWSLTALSLGVAVLANTLILPIHVRLVQTWQRSSLLSSGEEEARIESDEHLPSQSPMEHRTETAVDPAGTPEPTPESPPERSFPEEAPALDEGAQSADEKKTRQDEYKPPYHDDADNLFIWEN